MTNVQTTTEKVRNYKGSNSFILKMKGSLSQWGRLTENQLSVVDKILINEQNMEKTKIEELPTEIRAIVEYTGINTFVNDLKLKYTTYGRLTDNQITSGYESIQREKNNDNQKQVNIKLVGNTIKLGRKIASGIKEKYDMKFHPILVDVTEVVSMSDRAFKLKAKLTKENGGICRCCGKTLTDEVSIITGIGPICSKFVGVEQPKRKEAIAQYVEELNKKIDEIGEFEFWIPKRAIVEWNGYGGVMLKM
jgi:hypothetical protein